MKRFDYVRAPSVAEAIAASAAEGLGKFGSKIMR